MAEESWESVVSANCFFFIERHVLNANMKELLAQRDQSQTFCQLLDVRCDASRSQFQMFDVTQQFSLSKKTLKNA